MPNKLIQAQDVLLSKVNQMCGKFGLNNIMAQLYAILYLSNKSLCLDDMVDRLKISKGSASVNIRALERYGVVRQVWVKGSRKDYYEAEADISKVIVERMRSMVKGRLSEVDGMISSSYEVLNAVSSDSLEDAESVKVFKERLEKLRAFYDQAKSLFELFNMTILSGEAKAESKETAEMSYGNSVKVNV